MENKKSLLQELKLIDQLLELVNTKEEYDYLTAQAEEICPYWKIPCQRHFLDWFFYSYWLKGGESTMAWRPYDYVIEGMLDNTRAGKITGWMKFAGIRHKVRFDLTGNFHRDIQGTRIHINKEEPAVTDAKAYMKGFSTVQKGSAGDMTAGFEPADYVEGYVYLEWYSQDNGRVVIKLDQDRITVEGERVPDEKCIPVSRAEQAENMTEFLSDIMAIISKRNSKGAGNSSSLFSYSLTERRWF